MTRVVITGGGTGGHLYPALAVLEKLLIDIGPENIVYIGNQGRREAVVVPPYGIRFEGLSFSGMPRRINLSLISWGGQLSKSFFKARRLLQSFDPHVVFGTGGYITAPVLLAAQSLGISYVLHEPDASPGLVNRKMARWATKMSCAFEAARGRLNTRELYVTGNPLRSTIGHVEKTEALQSLSLPFQLDKPILLVTGGSQGARRLNQAVLEALPSLIETHHFQIIHQTGDQLFDEVMSTCPAAYRSHPAYVPMAFITDMAATLALADIAVCRSGSMTLSEMYRAHIPTILVPYPYAAADHQRQNALASQSAGASLMIEDKDFTGERLISALTNLMANPSTLQAMQDSAARLSAPDATRAVVELILSVAQNNLS